MGMFSSISDVVMECGERVSDDQKCTVKPPAIINAGFSLTSGRPDTGQSSAR